MPLRATPLVNEEYYHIFNRGVARQPTFFSKRDYSRFLLCLSYYRFNELPFRLSKFLQIQARDRYSILKKLEVENNLAVEIIAFCLMPNHFHILLQQKTNGGISKFVRQITDSHTRYINTKYDRVGPLFQGAFKVVHVETNEQLLHLSRYIHLNPLVSFIVKDDDFLSFPWSSLQNYLNGGSTNINTLPVLEQFKSSSDYLSFVLNQTDYAKQLAEIRHLTHE